jgi:hypothetical protein
MRVGRGRVREGKSGRSERVGVRGVGDGREGGRGRREDCYYVHSYDSNGPMTSSNTYLLCQERERE